MTFTSNPLGATVTTSLGYVCAATPCTIDIPRRKEFEAVFSKPGFKTATVSVKTKLVGTGVAGFAGNVLIGGVVGMAVDAGTGATLDHDPNPVAVTLEPVGAAPARRHGRRPRPTS